MPREFEESLVLRFLMHSTMPSTAQVLMQQAPLPLSHLQPLHHMFFKVELLTKAGAQLSQLAVELQSSRHALLSGPVAVFLSN